MARPVKRRRVCGLPPVGAFRPEGGPGGPVIEVTVDEYEAVRLIDLLGLTQEELSLIHIWVYALCERALIYDWCLSGGDYSLLQYGRIMMPMFLGGFRTSQKNFVQNI